MADRQRIVQVLNNLFANAARHAPETSPIRVEAACDGVHVAVSVSDEGPGIAPELLPQLFRKHARRLGADGGDDIAGAGLGLAICKGLVEAHGGCIRAESGGVGRGACFTFTLPLAADEGAASGQVRTAAPVPHAGAEPARILVVDDDPQTLRNVREALSQEGYAPLVTADPGEIADLIRAERPKLVLLGLMLPGMDGIKLMQQVPELADLPVIFISAYGRDETIARALAAGAALRRRAIVAGKEVTLTPTEYELLRILSVNAGRVVTSDSLLRQAWGERESTHTEPVCAFVKQLRAKLGDDDADPAYIFTERGVGYYMPKPGDTSGP